MGISCIFKIIVGSMRIGNIVKDIISFALRSVNEDV